jgi:hypothetical protein
MLMNYLSSAVLISIAALIALVANMGPKDQ